MSGLESFKEMLCSSEFFNGFEERTGTVVYDGDVIETIELVICSTEISETVVVFCASDESFIDIVAKPKIVRMRPL